MWSSWPWVATAVTGLLSRAAISGRRLGHPTPAAQHVPDVAAHQRDDVRFPQQGDGVVDGGPLEPALGDRQRAHFGFFALLGATREGSPSIFGYTGGHGASSSPAAWSRRAISRQGSGGGGGAASR